MVSKYWHSAPEEGAKPAYPDACPPPLDMKTKWFEPSTAYTMAKYGMSMCVLGLSGELEIRRRRRQRAMARTTIATRPRSAICLAATPDARQRIPDIMGDAALCDLHKTVARSSPGHFCIDDKVLYASGVRDFERYAVDPSVAR